MPDTQTPGETAYAAYCTRLYRHRAFMEGATWLAWSLLGVTERAAWEAAAQAVCTPCFQFALGQQVRWACEPEAVWRITYRASHDDEAEGLRLFYGIKIAESGYIRMAEEYELSSAEAPHG